MQANGSRNVNPNTDVRIVFRTMNPSLTVRNEEYASRVKDKAASRQS